MMNKGKKANAVGLLLGLQARQWFGVNKALHTKEPGEKAKLLAFGGLMVLVGALCVFTSVMYSVGLAALFGPLGALRLLPGAMMTASCLLSPPCIRRDPSFSAARTRRCCWRCR